MRNGDYSNVNTADKYLNTKIFFAKIMGFLVLFVSFQFSADGFGFKTDNSKLVGWILAFAVSSAQLIFNTSVKKLNWTIVLVGVIAYIYSIWTNILGFYSYRGETEVVWALNMSSIVPIAGGAFMDIFPEMALAWAFGAGGEGDLIGNLAKLNQVDKNGITAKSPIVEHQEVREERRPVPEEDLPPFLQTKQQAKGNYYDALRSDKGYKAGDARRHANTNHNGRPR
jgi:hypothetical protein